MLFLLPRQSVSHCFSPGQGRSQEKKKKTGFLPMIQINPSYDRIFSF